ncbi:hypothetical protein Lal_00015927 [Lupinus albus]|nr:hypothetical protein Lal_00015927 [Lupinus albus]
MICKGLSPFDQSWELWLNKHLPSIQLFYNTKPTPQATKSNINESNIISTKIETQKRVLARS